MVPIRTNQALWALLAVFIAAIIRFISRLRFQRNLVKGLPGPPHHPILGHLPIILELRKHTPAHLHPHTYPQLIKEQYGLGDVFYLDFWPAAPVAHCILAHPDVANQVTVKHSLPKHQAVVDTLRPLGGHTNMVSSDGPQWKRSRSMFNPGFAASHMMSLVPVMVDHGEVFAQILAEHSEMGDLFRLEEAATRLTVDIIGEVVMDTNLNAQRSENELVNAFRSQLSWVATLQDRASLRAWNPLLWAVRPVMFQWYARKMESYITRVLDKRFASANPHGVNSTKRKHVVDIALDNYTEGDKRAGGGSYDRTFRQHAIDQIRTFIFAGHDTTSSTICYVYHLLSKHPQEMAKVRKEHDDVFGTDPSDAAGLIKETPRLLSKLDYSLAVIKEVLRMYPPVSTVRAGVKGVFVTDPETGVHYPTEHFMVWPLSVCNHRNANIWDEPSRFKPERFLTNEGEAVSASTNAWRPFEKGPRNCIGQELALLETKIIMALTLRTFDIKAAYEDLKLLKNDGTNWPNDEEGVQEVFGDEAYQVHMGTAKPREGMPVRVTVRVHGKTN